MGLKVNEYIHFLFVNVLLRVPFNAPFKPLKVKFIQKKNKIQSSLYLITSLL